jgi:peptide-methionine (S)-S-oxide reductase
MRTLFLLPAGFLLLFAPVSANEGKSEFLVLGGGCFWCTEAAYELLPGVKSVVSGYAGGQTSQPTYAQVCTGSTGHAEVIRVEFDPAQITLERLLEYFWTVHDPTQEDGQGADLGPQYRSVVFFADDTQRITAEKSRAAAQQSFRRPIVTEILPLTTFWPAEDYHQDYFRRNPNQAYCRVVIAPKIRKLEQKNKTAQ